MTDAAWINGLLIAFRAYLTVQAVVIAIPAALIASYIVLSLYRRRILRSLRGSAAVSPTEMDAAAQFVATVDARAPGIAAPLVISPQRPVPLRPTLFEDARLYRQRLARLYSVAGVMLAICFAAAHVMLGGSGPPTLSRFLLALALFCAPVALNWLVLFGRWAPRTWVVFLLVCALFTAFSAEVDDPLVFFLMFTLLLALSMHSRVRAMAPLAMAFFSVVSVGTFAAVLLAVYLYRGSIFAAILADPRTAQLQNFVRSLRSITDIGTFLEPSTLARFDAFGTYFKDHLFSALATIASLSLLGLIVALALGISLVVVVSRAYARKRASAAWLLILSTWLAAALAVGSEHASLPTVLNLAFVALFALVVGAGWRRLRCNEQPGVHLLLLRSFSLGDRSDRFFQELESLWRGIGTVQLIGGVDLALTILEPHELLDFFRGRAHRCFLHSQSEVDARIATLDLERDPDGCFRVNALYCADAVWQYAVDRLMKTADCVLMDVRSFNRQRSGCVFEIQRLSQCVPASRVVFLTDAITDRAFVVETWTSAVVTPSAGADLSFVAEDQRAGNLCEQVVARLCANATSVS